MRKCGVLMPVASLPSRFGIGGFSKEAYDFVDFLEQGGQSLWQILPLGPTGYGDSPYQSFSTFAGNPYYISLDALIEDGLLTEEECEAADYGDNPDYINYEKIYNTRFALLRKAFAGADVDQDEKYQKFVADNAAWLKDYAMYMAIKDSLGGIAWIEWDEDIRLRRPSAMAHYEELLKDDIAFYSYLQYLFATQWAQLKAYANKKGIQIIGDIPIYVAFDSADTWANPELFQLDEENIPTAVAGCPPDAFSATGQLWGNPLYRWEYHRQTGYAWWIRRIAQCLNLYDCIRIDHFRGFDEYYSIPAGDETAEHGHWEPGPGMSLMQALKDALGNVNVIAEDLGFLTDGVRRLLYDSGFPGMKVIQFAFDSREESDYLPHNYEKNCVVYTGTHDNDTLCGWYKVLDPKDLKLSQKYMNNANTPKRQIHWDFIRLALASVADLCIIPLQDYLGLGSEARINTPSTLGNNWRWRMKQGCLTKELADQIRELTTLYGR